MSMSEDLQDELFTLDSPNSSIKESNARTGKLTLKGRNVIETPNFLAITSRGAVPHITPDVMLEHTGIRGVHISLEDFIEKAQNGTPPIMNCPARRSSPLHTFTALPSSITSLLAPRRTPGVLAPTGNTDHSIWVFSSVGFQPILNSSYINYVQILKPDIAVGLADIAYGSLPGTKRIEKMGDRTSRWLDSMLSELGRSAETDGSTPVVFAPILSIDYYSQTEYLHHIADDLANSISGLAFYSSSILPDIPATTAMTRLPRLSLDEPLSPHHILRQVSIGMDIFTIPFITSATDSGLALSFEFPSNSSADPAPAETVTNGSTAILPLAIDLSSPTHATFTTPLTPHCTCYACTSHHRAYIQHLLSAREMLGWVLLQIHNHHILDAFFSAIRESIAVGTFEACRERFEKMYESELQLGMGERPRARGYHFKSEGKGEPRRNKPAWEAFGSGEVEMEVDREGESNREGDETLTLALEGGAEELEERGVAEVVPGDEMHL